MPSRSTRIREVSIEAGSTRATGGIPEILSRLGETANQVQVVGGVHGAIACLLAAVRAADRDPSFPVYESLGMMPRRQAADKGAQFESRGFGSRGEDIPGMKEPKVVRPLGTMVTYGFAHGRIESDLALALRLGARWLEILPDWRAYPDASELRVPVADHGMLIHSAHGCWGGR